MSELDTSDQDRWVSFDQFRELVGRSENNVRAAVKALQLGAQPNDPVWRRDPADLRSTQYNRTWVDRVRQYIDKVSGTYYAGPNP